MDINAMNPFTQVIKIYIFSRFFVGILILRPRTFWELFLKRAGFKALHLLKIHEIYLDS